MWRANRPDLGIPLSEEAWELSDVGEARAAITFTLGDMLTFWKDSGLGTQLLLDESRAIELMAPSLAAGLMSTAATLIVLRGEFRRAVECAAAAEQIAQGAGAAAQLGCRAVSTHLRLLHGEIRDLDDAVPELDMFASLVVPGCSETLISIGQLVVFDRLSLGQWESADELAARVLDEARAVGLRGVEIFMHAIRGEVAWRCGRWMQTRAESLIEIQHNDLSEVRVSSFGHATLARVEAALGLIESSKSNASLAIEQGQRVGLGALEAWGRHALALAFLAEGDYDSALGQLEWISRLCSWGEIREPGVLWWQGDLLEAQWRCGRSDDAQRTIDQLRIDIRRTGSGWAAAMAARGSGLLSADPTALADSAVMLEQLQAPFEMARSRALIAEVSDPAHHRPDLHHSLGVFRQLGAAPWANRLMALLGAPAQAESMPEAAVTVLSKAELRVALAIARGMSNRACADALCVSPKTVDAHLQRIYRKLDVRSRTELALLMSRQADPLVVPNH